MGRNQIAAETGFSQGQVTRAARDMGLQWDRMQPPEAAAAQAAQIAAMRAELKRNYLRQAGQLLSDIESPHVAFNFGGRDNTYNEHELDSPPSRDKLQLMQASTLAAQTHMKLAELDDGAQVDISKSFVIALGVALGIHPGTSNRVQRTEPGAPPPPKVY